MKEALGYRQSMSLSKEGSILEQTTNTAGFRVGFFDNYGHVSHTRLNGHERRTTLSPCALPHQFPTQPVI